MVIKNKHLGYPLFLFIAILLAKVGYIGIESFYNHHVLMETTSPNLSRDAVEKLNMNGHRISSVGITLLLMPMLYFLLKRLPTKIMYSSLAIMSVVSYFISYNLLNQAVDYIVKTNKDKRHEAYYINVFKYGVLNNVFTYDSFINSQRVRDNSLNVNDRVLLTNTFLLLYADNNLISKLKERGKDKVAEVYADRSSAGNYRRQFSAYKEAVNDINFLWKHFNKQRNMLHDNLTSIDSDVSIKNKHKELIQSLKTSYKDYQQAWEKADASIEKETNPKNLKRLEIELNRYFRYQDTERAQKSYFNAMQGRFSRYIQPHEWLDSQKRVTRIRIKEVIANDIIKQVKEKTNELPKGLGAKEFSNHIDTKVSVSKKLKRQGILIPVSFDYSYSQFKKYYLLSMNKTINSAPEEFYKSLEKKLGPNDLKLDFLWNDFVNSRFIREKIRIKLNTQNKKDIDLLVKVIISRDLGNFKKMVYLPKVKKDMEKKIYKKEDFNDGAEAETLGDDAVKLLYVPPFALAVSMAALLLNVITVFGMWLSLTHIIPKLGVNVAKLALIVIIGTAPLISTDETLKSKMLNKVEAPQIALYIKFLTWVSFYEKLNAKLYKENLLDKFEGLLKE